MGKVDELRALRERRFARTFGPVGRLGVRTLATDPATSPTTADVVVPTAPMTVGVSHADDSRIDGAGRSTGGPRVRGVRPDIAPGKPIGSYPDEDLRALVLWINSDGAYRDEDTLLDAVMKELGFTRRGKNIKARVAAIVAA